jgi:hypothetical protein
VLCAVVGLIVLALVSMGVGWFLFHGRSGNKAILEARADVKREIQPSAPSEDSWFRRVTGGARGPSDSRNTPPPPTSGKPPTPNPAEPPPIPPKPPPREDAELATVTFEKQVLPILQSRCSRCHNTVKRKGGLDVQSVASLLQGGESGPAVRPGSLDNSVLWETLEADKMPPNQNKLSPAEKAIIRKWILTGAKTR